MNREIERKYLVQNFPENLEINKIVDITQSYLYRDKNTTIRIRKIKANGNVEYIYGAKINYDSDYNNPDLANKYEIESNISQEYYEELLSKKISNTINKTRFVVPIQNNLKVEIDVYHDYLEDFLTAEVEFPSEDDANNFEKPTWIGKEIGYEEFSNGKLSFMTRDVLLSKIDSEVLENNKKVIAKLKKNNIEYNNNYEEDYSR